MNEYDSNRIYDIAATIGFNKTESKNDADCVILNTCHIRNKATEKVYHEIGRIKKNSKNLTKPMVVVAGCVAQAETQEMIKREPYIDMVIGPQSYHKIGDLILNYQRKKKINATEFDVVNKFDVLNKIPYSQDKISSYLTIQEGCDKFCHFCVVPYTRGPEYSRVFRQIINEAKKLINNGAREIILLGQNVNAYNFSENKKNYRLSSIIRELNDIDNLKRIRYTTSHPKDMTQDLIDCYKNCEKLMPFLHLPIQSGSDKILKLMNRKHNQKDYLETIEKLRKINSNIKFSSDFIVGYPGETEKDFKDTVDLIEKVGFINSYSFIFSPRPGTPPSNKKLNNLLESKERLKKLQYILSDYKLKNNKMHLGKFSEVLVENRLNNKKFFFGRIQIMTSVKFESDNCKPGELINIQINNYNHNNLFGIHIKNKEKAA